MSCNTSKLKRNKIVWQAVALSRLSFNFFSGSALTFCTPHIGQIYWLISDLKLNFKKNLFHFGSFVDILSLFLFCLNAFCFYRPVDKFRLFCPSKLLPLSQKNLKFLVDACWSEQNISKQKMFYWVFITKIESEKMWNWTRIWSK